MDETTTTRRTRSAPRVRTCVGCGLRDDPGAMARAVVVGGEVVFDRLFGRPRAGGQRGASARGAHVHPRPACLAGLVRGLSRSLRREVRADVGELGRRLATEAHALIAERLRAARRRRAVAPGAAEGAPLVIVAVDWFSDGTDARLGDATVTATAVAAGRAIAWQTKSELGDLLGGRPVASCSVLDASIAGELVRLRAAMDAASATARTTKKGAECSKCPEAR